MGGRRERGVNAEEVREGDRAGSKVLDRRGKGVGSAGVDEVKDSGKGEKRETKGG